MGVKTKSIGQVAAVGQGVYTLPQFGWPGGDADIGVYLEAAIAGAAADHIGVIELPSGRLLCDREIVIDSNLLGPDSMVPAPLIRGQGDSETIIYFHNHTRGFVLNGTIDSPGGTYFMGGGLRDLGMIGVFTGGAPNDDHGITILECAFNLIDNVWVRGFNGYGMFIDNVYPNGQMDMHFNNCHIQLNRAGGIWCNSMQQCVFVNMKINQNLGDGVTFTSASNGMCWVGGLFQNTGRAMRAVRRDEPGDEQDNSLGLNLSMYGSFYVEQFDAGVPLFDFEDPSGSSQFNMYGSMNVNGGSATTPIFSFEGNYDVTIAGKFYAQGWAKHVKARNMTGGFVGMGLLADPSAYDFDAVSLANATFIGHGGISVGNSSNPKTHAKFDKPLQLMEVPTGDEPAIKGLIYDSTINKLRFSPDGAAWYSLTVDPFDIAIDLAPYLAEFWDAADATDTAGALSGWAGRFHETPFEWSLIPPDVTTSAELNNEKVVKFTKASSTFVDTGVLSGGDILAGFATDTPYVLTVLCHTPLSTDSSIQMVGQLGDASNEKLELKINENGASADALVTWVSGGFDSSPLALSNVAPAGHVVEHMLADLQTVGVRNYIQLDQSAPAGGGTVATRIGPITRVVLGTNLIGGFNDAPADVEIALHIVCHTRPPASVRLRLYRHIAERYSLTIAGI